MPAQIVKLEMAMRDGYDVIADQRTALCKAGLRSVRLKSSGSHTCRLQRNASARFKCVD
jgi:hypothetical protein